MQAFIRMAAAMLDADDDVARTVAGGWLDVVDRQAPEAAGAALLDRLPGARDLLEAYRVDPPGAPLPPLPDAGLFGSLTNAASAMLDPGSSMLGGAAAAGIDAAAGGLTPLAALFNQQCLDVSKVPQLVAMFARWAGEQAGPEVVRGALSAIPGVDTILATVDSLDGR